MSEDKTRQAQELIASVLAKSGGATCVTSSFQHECVALVEKKFVAQKKRGNPYAAFVFEPLMQGAAGMIPQPRGWLRSVAEIARAPGLAAWQPGELAETDEERRIWRFIKTHAAQPMPVYLGYGHEDRFAGAHELMARALPAAAVDIVPGGHGWQAWSSLWENFLDVTFT